MEAKGKNGEKWEYKRPKDGSGPIKNMKIDWKNGKFEFKMDKVDLSGLTNPKVIIRVSIYTTLLCRELIDMTVKKDKWEY